MLRSILVRKLTLLLIAASLLAPAAGGRAAQPSAVRAQSSDVTAFDLIIAMNTLRMSYGLEALIEDPIINAVAQATAETMAANQMSGHIGDVRGRLAAAGYGGGATVWGTENFAVGNYAIDEIMVIWSDEAHMIPAVNPAYCNIGAGVAKSSNGRTYYILQAAYTSGKSCGEYKSVGGITRPPGGSTGVSQVIIPVKIAKPDEDGKVFHVVEAGQSLWAIAIAYKITIKDIEIWNNISRNNKLQIGQRLFIPGKDTEGYATPTPVGMVKTSTPAQDGKIVHTVQEYQTLTTIANAYGTRIDVILALNGIQIDWPLQIGQVLLVKPASATSTPTPPPLTPIQMLTPASDGNYYHTVQSGETLLLIANHYEISLSDLMGWNGLNASSVIYPDQELLLRVTPPPSATPTPAPVTPTETLTALSPSQTTTPILPEATLNPTANEAALPSGERSNVVWLIIIGIATGGFLLLVLSTRKTRQR